MAYALVLYSQRKPRRTNACAELRQPIIPAPPILRIPFGDKATALSTLY